VLWNQWRLVADRELYDVESDPAQQNNVLTEHPDIVREMRRHYDSWWEGVAPEVNTFSRIALGNGSENPTLLSACEWSDVFLDQMAQVRRGEHKNGVWHVEVERDGQYELTLRRWPKEADTAISAGTPEFQGVDGRYPAGVALPIVEARMKLGASDQSIAVGPKDKAVTFTVALKRGPTELQTWFYDKGGLELCGAYFVYVRLL
jgi:hypothetical protein